MPFLEQCCIYKIFRISTRPNFLIQRVFKILTYGMPGGAPGGRLAGGPGIGPTDLGGPVRKMAGYILHLEKHIFGQ